ncbi:MAG: subclass B1 metallo-beta-lactamase [Pseudomonadales bacterium]
MKLIVVLLAVFLQACVAIEHQEGALEIKPIAKDVYLHTSYKWLEGFGHYPSNGLIVLNGNDAIIVDTPWLKEDTVRLVDWLEEAGLRPRASISTHFHDDRSSGISYLNKLGVDTYASTHTNELLAARSSPTAQKEFSETPYLLAGGKLEAYYPGAGHSADNIVIWLPESRILFGGCLIRAANSQSMGNTADGSVPDWAQSVLRVKDKYSASQFVVPGHGAIGGQELLDHTMGLAKKRALADQQASTSAK